MSITAIIFGASGQDGYYLSRLLEGKGIAVVGVSRSANPLVDLADFHSVQSIVNQYKPDYIFHLAADSTTSHDAVFNNHRTISTGTINILEAVKTISPASKVFISGSGLQFKNDGNPINEQTPFEARDAYSVSRIHSVYAARYYRSMGINAYVGYFFNHDSPRRTSRHISRMIADAVREIADGNKRVLEIGDPSVVKEWAFAGDIVEAVWTLVEQDKEMEAVIGSGIGYAIQTYIEYCFAYVNLDWKDHVKVKEGFRSGYKALVSDPSKMNDLGWKPKTSIQELVKLMLEE